MRKPVIIALAVLVTSTVLLGAAALRLRLQDPLAALPCDPPGAVAVASEWNERLEGRTLVHVTLHGAAVGDVRFVVSLPDPLPPGPMPVIVVLGGLEGGTRSIRRLGEALGDLGPNAFAAYDWPLPYPEPSTFEVLRRLPELRRSALSTPGQVDALLAWAARQPWADRDRVSLLGFSLGAFVAPATQRVAEARGAALYRTVIAYGGASIGDVVAGHPAVKPAWAAGLLGAGMDLLLRPVEPGEHLPHLRGRFLLLRAGNDRLIARAAADRLAALTPEPRTIVVIEGDHMGLRRDKQKLLDKVVAITRTWLIEERAMAPVAERPRSAPVRGRTDAGGADVSYPR